MLSNDEAPVVLLVASEGAERDRLAKAFHAANVRIEIWRREQGVAPHVIFLDLNPEAGSGFECLKTLKATPALSGVPVIAMTRSNESKDVERAYSLGVNACVRRDEDEGYMRAIAQGVGDFATLRAAAA